MAGRLGEGTNAHRSIVEGVGEKQEVPTGPIGPPSNAMSMTGYGAHRVVTIRVSRSYRGQIDGSVRVVTGMGGGDCGFDFETGEEYLVYVNSIDGGLFCYSIFNQTTPMADNE